MEREYKYDAFISYRHLNPDKDIADKLQRMLESYTPPKALREEGKWEKWHIFRDETELPTSSNLGDDIKNALDNSNFLIVICSPKTAESRWCMEEIEYFKKIHNGNNTKIITVVASGTPEEAFPDELCKELVEVVDDEGNATYEERIIEPLAANVASENTKDAIKKLKEEFLRVVAPMLGCGYDDLYNREQKKKTKRIIISSLCAIFAFALFSIYNGIMLYRINLKNQELEEANYNLQVEKSEVNVSHAETMQDLGNSYEAVKYAYEAIPKGGAEYSAVNEAERILADAMGVYSQQDKIQRATPIKISGRADYMEATEDGKRIIVSDNTDNVYLIDAEKREIIKTFTPYETFNSVGGYYGMDIAVSGDVFYVGHRRTLISINAEDGSENWRSEGFYCYKIVTNAAADTICAFDSNDYCLIDKKSGNILKKGEISEYLSTSSDCFYMSSDGTVYAVGEEMHIIKQDSYKKISLDISKSDEVFSMGESEDAVYINIGKDGSFYFDKAELICIEKSSDEIKWKTSYPTDEVSRSGHHKIFPLKHEIEKSKADDTMIEVDGIAVVTDNAVYMFDEETGDRYAGRELSGDVDAIMGEGDRKILACGKSSEKSKISMITDKLFYHSISFSTYGYFGGGILGRYLPAEDVEFATLLKEGYAFYETLASEIIIVDYVKCASFVEIPGLAFEDKPSFIKDAEDGTVVAAESVYPEDGERFYRIKFYDGEKVTGVAQCKTDRIEQIFIADGRVLVAGGEKLILCDFEGNILDEAVLEEKMKVFFDDDVYISGNIDSIASEGKEIFITTYKESIAIDISEDKINIKNVNGYSGIGAKYASDKSIEFVAIFYDEKEGYSCKIANISASGINFVKKDGEDYIFTNEAKNSNASDVIGCVTYSDEAGLVAFCDISGFIGIYKAGEENFAEIKYDLNDTVLNVEFSKNGKYLFALMANGKLVKYSVETLSPVAENETDILVSHDTRIKEIDDNTLVIDNSSAFFAISGKTLELKAKISYAEDISYDKTKFYVSKRADSGYIVGYYEYLSREKLKEKAKEFLGI